jgi:hypothetical protein
VFCLPNKTKAFAHQLVSIWTRVAGSSAVYAHSIM